MIKNQETKCVEIIDENLPLGILANTAAILGITIGKQIPELVGKNAVDASGQSHLGIITIPIPILKGNKEIIRELREKIYTSNYDDMVVVDFSDVAQRCNIYSEYLQKASKKLETEYTYFGLAICGNKKIVNSLTGSMPLLR